MTRAIHPEKCGLSLWRNSCTYTRFQSMETEGSGNEGLKMAELFLRLKKFPLISHQAYAELKPLRLTTSAILHPIRRVKTLRV